MAKLARTRQTGFSLRLEEPLKHGRRRLAGQKNTFFQKRTGELIENTGKGYMDSQKRTEKRSGEVVENTYLWEKRTENEPENEATDMIENNWFTKNVQDEPESKTWQVVRKSQPTC